MKFLIFSGTLRQGQCTEHVARFVLSIAQKHQEHEWEWIDPRQLGLTYQDEGEGAAPSGFKDKVNGADGYIIVSPEYNHGYPGTIKYVLDLNLKEYIHKPVAFVGVSNKDWGGTRMIEALVGVVRELGLVATFNDLNFTHCRDEIENGQIKDPEKWERRTNRLLDELLWMAQTLKYGRGNVPSEYHQ